VSIASLTAQLPTVAGALPDLFRRTDATAPRADESPAARADAATADDGRATTAHSSDDLTRMLARRTALGPLTYGRQMAPTSAMPAAPMGMRGAHLDVRG